MAAERAAEALLIVEDEEPIRRLLLAGLAAPGRSAAAAATVAEARAAIAAGAPDVVLLDLKLPDESGLEVLRTARAADPACMVVVLTGHVDERTVVEAMQLGAMTYVTKPFAVPDLLPVVEQAFRRSREARAAAGRVRDEAPPFDGFLVGGGPAMVEVYRALGLLAASEVPVLVTGESGTGKELVARALHRYGPRREGPFVTVDCASLPAGLLESELFGHERGAFTGADRARAGKFEEADGGTIFLDEVGNVPLEMQAKLLRAVQERTITRLGSNAPVKWNARLVAATNADLRALAAEGKYREDLRYRLAGAEIRLPPLRDRLEDVPRLAEHFLARHAAGGRAPRLSEAALARLCAYAWPGNVRELEHALARAAALARTAVIGVEELPAEARGLPRLVATGPGGVETKEGLVTLEEAKRRYARHALALCGGNKSEAARLLDIDRSTLASLLAASKEGG